MQFARINDVAIHYQLIGGPADKPVLVFANAVGTDFRIWRDVIVRLAGDFPIILYDKRGHGLSEIGQVPYSVETHASDLIGLLDLLAVKQAVLCGLSIGGQIAMSVYRTRPELVRALILCDTAHKIGTPDMWDARIKTVEDSGIASIADGTMERWFTPAFRRPENVSYAGYRNMLVRQPAEGYLASCAAVRDADLTEAAKAIRIPTICIAGDQDGSTPPEVVMALAKLIPDARFETIRDAGHLPCVEQPEMLVEIIRAFLDFVDARPSGSPS